MRLTAHALRPHIALAQNTSIALFYIAGSPGCVELVQGDQPLLHVHARAHLGRRADQYPVVPAFIAANSASLAALV